jgi:hypothetical protein
MAVCPIKLIIAALFVVLAAQAAVASAPETIATFADPGTTSFIFTGGTGITGLGQLDARNVDILLDIVNGPLAAPGNVIEFPDASFVLTDAAGGLLDVTAAVFNHRGVLLRGDFEGGILEFYDDTDGGLILGAVFDEAWLTPLSFGSEFGVGTFVDFYGPAAEPQCEECSFSFARATVDNPTAFTHYSLDGFTSTASFTSSAIVVPEPSVLVPVLSGCIMFCAVGVGARRRRMRPN